MRTLVINMKPFTFSQKASILDGGEEIKTIIIPMNQFEETVFVTAYQYNIDEILLAGPQVYTKGFKRKINNKYNEHKLNIRLI